MARENFLKSLARVLVHEGGFANHPKDPGGATMNGVTQRTYDSYRRRRNLEPKFVRVITAEERNAIYKLQYWDAVKGDLLPPGIDYAVFDGAVNSGPSQSVKWLQRALVAVAGYTGKVDGLIGQQTLAAIEAVQNHDRLIALMLGRRLTFLENLSTWSTFGGGWRKRVSTVREIGQAWARGDVGPEVVYIPNGNAKATIEDAKKAPPAGPADAAAGGGAIVAPGGLVVKEQIDTIKETVAPMSGDGGIFDKILVFVTIAGVLLVIGGLAWRWYARRKGRELADALDLEATV